jgi:hypothetical protein
VYFVRFGCLTGYAYRDEESCRGVFVRLVPASAMNTHAGRWKTGAVVAPRPDLTSHQVRSFVVTSRQLSYASAGL